MSLSVSRAEAARELLARRRARSNLLDFTLYTFPTFEVNWHHRLLCDYLTRFAFGEIKRLLIFAPPRHTKSELVSRRLPAFIFGLNPNASIIAASYSSDLAIRMNRDAQRIIDSPEYHRLFPETNLFGKQTRAFINGTYLRNADVFEIVGKRGIYRGAGVGGGLTGMGFDFGIIDDPFKDRSEANSPTIRQNRWDWYSSVFYTRQQPDAGMLITHTRWHPDDMAGRILNLMRESDLTDRWTVLNLPAIANGQQHTEDPRAFGEALWPERYPLEYLEKVRANNAYEFEALYQQNPLSQSGGLFDVDKIEMVDVAPACKRIVRFYDLAVTAKRSADFTAGGLMGITEDERPVILGMYRAQKEFPDVEQDIIKNAQADGKAVHIRLEAEKAGIIGLSYLLRRPELHGYVIDAVPPVGDKYTRAQPFATRVNAGRTMMVRGPWNQALKDEMAMFGAHAAHDDQVDTLSGGWDMLSEPPMHTSTALAPISDYRG